MVWLSLFSVEFVMKRPVSFKSSGAMLQSYQFITFPLNDISDKILLPSVSLIDEKVPFAILLTLLDTPCTRDVMIPNTAANTKRNIIVLLAILVSRV